MMNPLNERSMDEWVAYFDGLRSPLDLLHQAFSIFGERAGDRHHGTTVRGGDAGYGVPNRDAVSRLRC